MPYLDASLFLLGIAREEIVEADEWPPNDDDGRSRAGPAVVVLLVWWLPQVRRCKTCPGRSRLGSDPITDRFAW